MGLSSLPIECSRLLGLQFRVVCTAAYKHAFYHWGRHAVILLVLSSEQPIENIGMESVTARVLVCSLGWPSLGLKMLGLKACTTTPVQVPPPSMYTCITSPHTHMQPSLEWERVCREVVKKGKGDYSRLIYLKDFPPTPKKSICLTECALIKSVLFPV